MELIIDGSSHVITGAIGKEEKYSTFTLHSKIKHSQKLMDFVDLFLKENNLDIKDIKKLGVSIGPGSFTGLRIAVAFIKGIASALNLNIAPIPTTDIYSWLIDKDEGYIVLPAREGYVYTTKYSNKERISEYQMLSYEEAIKIVEGKEIVGYGAEKLGIEIPWYKKYPNGISLVKAYKNIKEEKKPNEIELIYVQEPLAIRELEKRNDRKTK